MSSYFINNTSGTMELIVNPGELNGAGGKVHSTDLRLYGMGALKWGEGVDENFVRLLESFSCPQKELGDYGIDNEPESAGLYNPSVDRIWPKGPKDQEYSIVDPLNPEQTINIFTPGPGVGISEPINGQVWFNTAANAFMVYHEYEKKIEDGFGVWTEISGGIFVGPTPPTGAALGDLWYDTSGNLCNRNQLMVYDPSHPSAEIHGWVSVAANYLKKCGDTMGGPIDMGGYKISNIAFPSDPGDVVSKEYADDAYVNETGDTMIGPLYLNENSSVETDTTRVLNQQKSDERYVWRDRDNISGNAMTGWLQLKNVLPDMEDTAHEYYSVPVKLLKDYIGSGASGAFYYGNYWFYASQRGGPIKFTFDFAQWKIDFAAEYGNSDNFVVIGIPTFEQFLVPNSPSQRADRHGSIGGYGLVFYNARGGGASNGFYPDPANKTKLSVVFGPDQVRTSNLGIHRNYSVYGRSRVRVHFFGGNINIKSLPTPSQVKLPNGY